MTLTPQQLAAVRRQRRAAEEAAAEDRIQQWVGEAFGLGGHDGSFLPDPEQVGWMQADHPEWVSA